MSALNQPENKGKRLSKGDRLNWTPISEVKSVSLTGKLIIGKQVSSTASMRDENGDSEKPNFFIP